MLICINKNSVEYQSLKAKAGIPEFILESVCRSFLEEHDRFPHLDELPDVNSEPSLREALKVKNNGGTQITSILEYTGRDNLEEAVVDINTEYSDLETEITPINQEAIVEITHRPTDNNFDIVPIKVDEDPNSFLVLDQALSKLASLYGIRFNQVNDSELNSEQWKGIITDPSAINAFIYNGQIYINVDRNSVDAPLHEMMHLFVGSIRFTNPSLYQELVGLSESFPNYELLSQQFRGKSRNDLNEEIFVTEVSKLLTGQPSNLNDLDPKLKYEITYNIKRVLDSILMGQDSVKTISEDRLYTLSLKQIAQEVNSSVMNNNFHGTINVEGSELHRRLNNLKSDLINQGTLEEICE